MNFTILPKHVEVEPIGDLTTDDALVFSLLAIADLGWRPSNIGDLGLYAYPDYQGPDRAIPEELTIQIDEDKLIVTSTSARAWDVISSKNRMRVREFRQALRRVVATTTPEQGSEKLKEATEAHRIVPVQVEPLHSTISFNPLFFFTPKEGYFITPILLNLNIVCFLAMTALGMDILEPDPSTLMAWGGNFRGARVDGEWWRLITSTFLHNGFVQFTLNMYALVAIGWMIEPQIGKTNFLGTYLSAAVASSMASLLWLDDTTVSSGASGPIFGLYGVFIALLSTKVIERANRPILIVNTLLFMAYTFLTGLKPGMSNVANITGISTGILIGYCLYPVLLHAERSVSRYVVLGSIMVVLGGSVGLAYRSLPGGDMADYNEHIREFAELNKKAVDVLDWNANADPKKVIREIKSTSIPTLDQQIKVLKNIENLSVPEETKARARELIKYCIYRVKVYQIKLRILEGKSKDITRDENEISYYTVRIDALVEDFASEFDIVTKSI